MTKRITMWLIATVVAVFGLFTGSASAGAQTLPPLSETFAWDAHGVTVAYPAGWTVVETADLISIRLAGRDVSDGTGPELILFTVADVGPDQLDAALARYAPTDGSVTKRSAPALGDHAARSTTFERANPATVGGITLIALDDRTALGVAYIVRAAEAPDLLPVLEAISRSVALDEGSAEVVPVDESISASVASVQLPQQVEWADAGLTLYFPADWTVSVDPVEGLTASPDALSVVAMIQGQVMPWSAGLDLREVIMAAAGDQSMLAEPIAVTVAGYPGVIYDIVDDADTRLHIRALTIAMDDREQAAVFFFGTDEAGWAAFRSVADAFMSSIEQSDGGLSARRTGAIHALALRVPPTTPLPFRQDSSSTKMYDWEEYGITFTLPADWQALSGTQDYDLALVSPGVMESGEGAFITFRGIPTLGPDTTMEQALTPIAEDMGGEVSDFVLAGRDGKGIVLDNAQNGVINNLILIPYDDKGALIYIQTVAPPDQNQGVIDILDSMEIDPPVPDYAAADAAFQASLAESGRLIYGDPDAPIEMVEYLSFTCGHCANYSYAISRLIALDVDPGRVQIELALIAGDQLATAASHAAMCAAEQGKGYSAYTALFAGYVERGYQEAYSREGINDILSTNVAGLDMDALNACIDEQKYQPQLDEFRVRFMDNGLTGTPTVLLGVNGNDPATIKLPDGQVWSGTIPIAYLRQIFSLLEEGVALEDVFDHLRQ
mgnify:CR=1 FL=1